MLVSLTAGFSFLHWVYFYSNNIHTFSVALDSHKMINTFQHNGTSSQVDQAAVVAAAAELLLGGGGTEQEQEQVEEHELLFSSSDFYNCNFITSPPPPTTPHVPNTFNIDQLDDDSFINNLLFPSSYSSCDENILPLIDVHNNDFQQFCYSNNYPKRQKIIDDVLDIHMNNHQLVLPSSSDFVTSLNHHSLLLDYAAVFPPPPPTTTLPQITLPPEIIFFHSNATLPSFYPGDNIHMTNAVKRPNDVENVSLSAQSVAARQRRRKITEKTHQLGKLIPGASWNNSHNSNNKLNTADMFQAAFKYVKFLQAQVGILQLMQEGSSWTSSIDLVLLEVLLTSPTMQEKLYLEEKCLVSNEYLEILAKEDEILESYPLISKDLNSLLVVHHHEHMESTTTTTTT